jgi:hypothetical protein
MKFGGASFTILDDIPAPEPHSPLAAYCKNICSYITGRDTVIVSEYLHFDAPLPPIIGCINEVVSSIDDVPLNQ